MVNPLLDKRWLRFEQRYRFHDSCVQSLLFLLFACFHNLDYLGINHDFPLVGNLLMHLLFVLVLLESLLLIRPHRDEIQSSARILKLLVHRDLFVGLELRLLDLLGEELGLWVAEIEKRGLDVDVRNIGEGLKLLVGVSLFLVKEGQQGCLEGVHYKLVPLLLLKLEKDFNLAILVQPCQLPVLVLRIVEDFEFLEAHL